jgi:hypothetical protein
MINILTDSASGGTFLTWTMHYLAGHKQYYLSERNRWTTLTPNPLVALKNAHAFVPNQPNRIFNCNVQQFQKIVKDLESTDTDTFHTLYFHPFTNSSTAQAALEYINTGKKKLIVVDTSDTPLYHCSYRKRFVTFTDSGKILSDYKDIQEHFIKKYFSESKDEWDKLNLTELWDIREFLALNCRPFLVDHVYKSVDKTRDHLVIKGSELWTSLAFILDELFDHCEIGIDQQRLSTWQEIYNTWKKNHHQKLMFSIYFETIVDSILNNYSMDLSRFYLDIEQEAAIQHVLIYRHNLNLKTWQLEKFINTKQLHNLLEPNIHKLSS